MTTVQDILAGTDTNASTADQQTTTTPLEGLSMLPEDMKVKVEITFLGVSLTLKQVNATYHALTALQLAHEIVKNDPNVDMVKLGIPDITERMDLMVDALIESDLINEFLFPDERYLVDGADEFAGGTMPEGRHVIPVREKRSPNTVKMTGKAMQELFSGVDPMLEKLYPTGGDLVGSKATSATGGQGTICEVHPDDKEDGAIPNITVTADMITKPIEKPIFSWQQGESKLPLKEIDRHRLIRPIEGVDKDGYIDLSKYSFIDYARLITSPMAGDNIVVKNIIKTLMISGVASWCADATAQHEDTTERLESTLHHMENSNVLENTIQGDAPILMREYKLTRAFKDYCADFNGVSSSY